MRPRVAFVVVLALTDIAGADAPVAPLTFHFEPLDSRMRGPSSNADFVDFGRVAATGVDYRRGVVVRQRIGLRLEGGPGARASARVSVALATETPGCVVRVDGIALSSLPRVIDPVHRVGSTVAHQIEMTIPPNIPPGQLLNDLQWSAETD